MAKDTVKTLEAEEHDGGVISVTLTRDHVRPETLPGTRQFLIEAITLSDQVDVMTKWPGRTKETYRLPPLRPRDVFEIYLERKLDEVYEALWRHFKAAIGREPATPAFPTGHLS